MKRRELLKRGAALAVAASPYVITARSQETLIVNTQGGEYQELVEKVVIQPFETKFGVKVIHDATVPSITGTGSSLSRSRKPAVLKTIAAVIAGTESRN